MNTYNDQRLIGVSCGALEGRSGLTKIILKLKHMLRFAHTFSPLSKLILAKFLLV